MSELPSGWADTTIGGVLDSCEYGISKSLGSTRIGTPVLRMGNLGQGGLSLSDLKYANLDEFEPSKVLLNAGDILFNRTNSMALVGKVGFVTESHPTLSYASYLLRLRTTDAANSKWLYYLLDSPSMQQQLRAIATPGVSQANINPTRMRRLPILLPPLPEQRKIADILSSVDEAIAATAAVIEQTRTVKKGLLQELLTKGIGHTTFKQTEVGEIPASWEVKRLGELTALVTSGLSRRLSSQDIGLPVVTSTHIQEGKLVPSGMKYWYVEDPKGARTADYHLDDGDILLCFINSLAQIGKCCIYRSIGRPAIYTTNLFRIKVVPKHSSEFIFCVLSSSAFQAQVKLITKPAVNQASFTKPELLRIRVAIPPRAEQDRIVEVVTTIDASIERTSNKLSQLRQLKKGLLQDLLTGKKRVTV